MGYNNATTLIAATTDAVTTKAKLSVFKNQTGLPVTVTALGLAAAEEVDIYISDNDGATWTVLPDGAGNAVKLTATVQTRVIYAAGTYGFIKDATAAAVAVKAFGP